MKWKDNWTQEEKLNKVKKKLPIEDPSLGPSHCMLSFTYHPLSLLATFHIQNPSQNNSKIKPYVGRLLCSKMITHQISKSNQLNPFLVKKQSVAVTTIS